jgi:hypothetical protein
MRSKVILLVIFSLIVSMNSYCQNSNSKQNDTTEIIFNETDHNFGTINYQGDGSFEFVFKNTGKAPLIIKNVQSSCGCTTPEWTKEPVAPKAKGKIIVRYDTERIGSFIKSIKVFSNAKNSPVELIIRGEVKAKQ